jgi:hypothetical protein
MNILIHYCTVTCEWRTPGIPVRKWEIDWPWNSFKLSSGQTKPIETVSIGFGFGNFVRNRTVWFPVWQKVAQTKPNQTSPTLAGAAWCQSAVIGVQRFPLWTPPSLGFQISHSLGVCACLDDSLFHCLSNELLWRLSGACLIIGLSWVLPLGALAPPFVCSLENEWVFLSHGVTRS